MKRRKSNGFVLVLVLGLVAFMLTLILTLTTLTRVELVSAEKSRQTLVARTNALLALQIAIGRLQKATGPDQRVTANARLMSTTKTPVAPGKSEWVGAWDTTEPDAAPTWLVSGKESPFEASSGKSTALVSGTSNTEEIRVPNESIKRTALSEAGVIAYWVSDESQKARLDLTDVRIDRNEISLTQPSLIEVPAVFGSSAITPLDKLREAMDFTDEGSSARSALSRISSLEDLAVYIETLNESDSNMLQRSATTTSRGLLTDAKNGGFRNDLSAGLEGEAPAPSGPIFPNGPAWDLLRDFVALYGPSGESASEKLVAPVARGATSPSGQLAGEFPSRHGIAPVPIFWEYLFEVSPEPPANYQPADTIPLHLRIQPIVALLNPYDVTLEKSQYIFRLWSGGGTYNPPNTNNRRPAFFLRFTDGPQRDLSPERLGNYLNEWLPDFTGHGGRDGPDFQENGLRVAIDTELEPGEIKIFSLASDVDLPGVASDYILPLEEGEPMGFWAKGPDISSSLDRTLKGSDYDSGRELELVLRGGSTVGVFSLGEIETLQLHKADNLITTIRTRYFSQVGREVSIARKWKGPLDTLNSTKNPDSRTGVRALVHYNLRSSYQSNLPGQPLEGYAGNPLFTPRSDSQSTYIGQFNFWDPGVAGDLRPVLFHVPQNDILSLGQLQHANLSRNVYSPAYAVGNSFASPWIDSTEIFGDEGGIEDLSFLLNDALWDKYFFSGIPRDPSKETIPRNRRYQPLVIDDRSPGDAALLDFEEAARWLFVDGPFNVNSTSVEAWTAFLSSFAHTPLGYEDVSDNTFGVAIPDSAAFARMPEPAGEVVPHSGEGGSADATTAEYWRGFRSLTEQQVANLAGQIVAQVNRRGPFLSLSEFVNRSPEADDVEDRLMGPLQAAINATEPVDVGGDSFPAPSINPPDEGNRAIEDLSSDEIDYPFPEAVLGNRSAGAPGYLTQADILSALGPVMTVRGDTFRIRAYGEHVNPITGEGTKAYCEAVLQRVPAYIDLKQNPLELPNGTNEDFGRRFIITNFRWLSEDSI